MSLVHMADALVSPAVGGTMWVATAATTVYCAKRVREMDDPARIPLMGVAGAFVFAAQMINFTIPGTGSSGHLGGGLLLAILLGPEAAFLVMASVLTVQALFFADGGLLALGANIFNLGFFPAFIAYPLIYRPIVGGRLTRGRVFAGSVLGAIVALQLGALAVVLETTLSGLTELPLLPFALVMQPIHLAIGLVEGLVTGAVVLFVARAQPELFQAPGQRRLEPSKLRGLIAGLAIAAVIVAGVLSWFASGYEDGLEWSISRVTAGQGVEQGEPAARAAGAVQERTALMRDYSLGEASGGEAGEDASAVNGATSAAGLVGVGIVLLVVVAVGYALRRRSGAGGPDGS
jgi:cobalt/nickel transport system permease protein